MLVPMTKVRIIGRRSDVGRMVDELHQLGLVELADARSSDAVEELGGEEARATRRGELQALAAQIDAMLRDELAEELAARVHVAWTRVDDGAIGCLVAFPHQHQQAVRALLGRAQVRRAELPEAFERLSLRAAVEAMQRRVAELPRA